MQSALKKKLLQKLKKIVWRFEEPCFYWFPPCIIVFFERSGHLLGKIVVFVRTEYREYLFLEKTALAVIGWEHILGLTLQSWHCEDDEDEEVEDDDDDDNCENLNKAYDDDEED